jgi:hypothetical protein
VELRAGMKISKVAITQFQQRVWWLVPALVPIIVIPK